MISIFQVTDDFCFVSKSEEIRAARVKLIELFPDSLIELFYYVKASEENRYFILRVGDSKPPEFIRAAKMFSEMMKFSALDNAAIIKFLNRTARLDDYC